MTEQQWLCTGVPNVLLAYVRDSRPGSERKLRLFAVACCRRIWRWLKDERLRNVVEIAERFAEGIATHSEMLEAERVSQSYLESLHAYESEKIFVCRAALATGSHSAYDAAIQAWGSVVEAAGYSGNGWKSQAMAVRLIHDIFSNPFRPITLNPTWLTPTVVSLAQAAYDERILPSGELDLARLAVLADALEHAGCHVPGIFGHYRQPGPHVRGCWAVDLILGKE